MARRKMPETELTALLDAQINDAISYDKSDLKKLREKAIAYRDGVMDDVPAEEGYSSVVSRDVADTIGWIAPSLARVFLASEHIAVYEPQNENDREFAAQATDYIGHVVMKDCNGYSLVSMAMDDALLLGNGIFKHWWDETPSYKVESETGLSEGQYLTIAKDDEVVEILEQSEYQDDAPPPIDPMTGLPDASYVPGVLYDVKFKRVEQPGRLVVKVLPPEEFLIERAAKALNEEDCRFCAHRWLETRSNLVKAGYSKEKVYEAPTYSQLEDDTTGQVRDHDLLSGGTDEVDRSVEKVEVFECYVLVDYDGDDVAEWRRIVMAGGVGARNVLLNEEWAGDLPFTDIAPDPIPHRWRGRSIFDETQDIQRIKTVVLRQILDNLYLSNNPVREVVEDNLQDIDEIMTPKLGQVVRVKQAGAIRDIAVPFVAEKAFAMLEYADMIVEKRTGVSRSTMALDPDALQNQTATAVQAQQASAYSKIELYARNIAENGMTRLFRCLLKLVVANQDRPRTIRLRDKFVEMDPQSWNADMDVTVNTGLGAGSRDRDLRMLASIKQAQEMVMQAGGLSNPLVSLAQYANTLRLMVETSGIKAPDRFFSEIGGEQAQQLQQQMNQPKPDPKMMEVQARLQMDQARAAGEMQLAQQKAAGELQLQREKAEANLMAQREEGQLKIQLMREEAAAKIDLEVKKAQANAQLRRDEILLEAELTQQANEVAAITAAQRPMDTNLNGQADLR